MRGGLVLMWLAGCTLDARGKNECRLSADCDPGHSCNEEGLCEPITAPRTLGEFAEVPSLHLLTPRAKHSAAHIGRWLYIIGGKTPELSATLERARIGADGALGPFEAVSTVMLHARADHSSAVVGGHLCVVGGVTDDNNGPQSECAPIEANDDLGSFVELSGVRLGATRFFTASVVLQPYLYVLGGYNKAFLDTVERSTIGVAGLKSNFDFIDPLPEGRPYAAAAVLDDFLYILGGVVNSNFSWSVERAPILSGGAIGGFEQAGLIPDSARQRAMLVRVGRTLYLLGGQLLANSAGGTVVQTFYPDRWFTTIGADGRAATFQSGGPLQTLRNGGVAVHLGRFVYVIGGQTEPIDGGSDSTSGDEKTGPPLDSVERAELR